MTERARPLRADAERNREQILTAAREVFAEQGLDVSLRQIARRADVSEPTLRRRFASKEELVAEAFVEKVTQYADLAEAAVQNPDPGAGFREFIDAVAAALTDDESPRGALIP